MERNAHRTILDPALIEAYRATRYRVFGPRPFELQVDRYSPPLDALLRHVDAPGAAYVTAWNPRGEILALALNRRRQDALRADLRGQGLRFIEGFGAHADDQGQGEESLLVLGAERRAAVRWGERLEQNAILWSGRDAIPRLILLR
jgi:hypothetical protein